MENHSYDQVIGRPDAPFVTGLVKECASATHEAVVGSPSLPNYLGATAGQSFGISDDDDPSSHTFTADNLFRQVRKAGGRAISYEESMPANCALKSSGTYGVRHNPATYYVGADDRQACRRDNVPMGTTSRGALIDAVEHDTLPTFSFVTPNVCHDTHDCSVAVGDQWLARLVPRLLGSAAYARGDTAIIISWDEETPIPNVWLAPSVTPGARVTDRTNHYAALRTIEEMLGLPPLASAATALSYRSAFGL